MSDKKEEKVDNGLAAKIRKLEEKVDKTVRALERLFGIDIDKDGKVGAVRFGLIAMLSVIAVACFAAEVIRQNQSGTAMITFGQDSDGIPNGDLTIAGDLSVSGSTTIGEGVTFGGSVLYNDGSTYQFYTAPLASLPGTYSVYFDDFYDGGYVADAIAHTNASATKFSESADAGVWLVSNTDTDGDNGEILVIADSGPGGLLDICNNNNAADKTTIQMNGTSFKLKTGKKFWFETKFSCEDVDTNSFYIGLATADTDVIGSLPNDNIGFYVSKVAATKGKLQIVVETGNTNKAYVAATLNDNSSYTNMTTAGFYYDGASTIRTWVKPNDTTLATSTQIVDSATVPIPTDVFLSPVISFGNGNTDTDHLYVDYIKIIQQR